MGAVVILFIWHRLVASEVIRDHGLPVGRAALVAHRSFRDSGPRCAARLAHVLFRPGRYQTVGEALDGADGQVSDAMRAFAACNNFKMIVTAL